MTIGRLILLAILGAIAFFLWWTALWQVPVLFFWQHPMLTWLPFLTFILVGLLFRFVASLQGGNVTPFTDPLKERLAQAGASTTGSVSIGDADENEDNGETAPKPPPVARRVGFAALAAFIVFCLGIWFTYLSPPAIGLDDIEFEFVDELPAQTQPRLLPRTGVRDDPSFYDASEIHLTREPESGALMWTGEWQPSSLNGESAGVVVKRIDDVLAESEVIRGGFKHSVSGIGPGTLRWKGRNRHPFSRTQYPVLVPLGDSEVIAVAPYVGYRGFPIRTPFLKGVLVYDQEGEVEDLTPEEAAARPELARTGRLVPEAVARKQAESLGRTPQIDGKINDGEGNRQPFLTSIDREQTSWITVLNEDRRTGGVKAVVLADSSTGFTQIWVPNGDQTLTSTQDVVDMAKSMPLRWSERRCCDSDGHSYTVTLREVVEPRLAIKDSTPYYMVSVVPTKHLALPRQIEYTLLIDAQSGELLETFHHTDFGSDADRRLEEFFKSPND